MKTYVTPFCSSLAAVAFLCAASNAQTSSGRDVSLGGSGPKRLASIIGNDAYPSMPLKSAVNDARALSQMFKIFG